MPITNEYHIYIHGDNIQKKTPSVASKEEEKETKFGKIISFAQIKATANKFLAHDISMIGIRTGASEYTERLNYVRNIGSTAISSGLMIATAFKVSNPVGIATLLFQAVDKATSLLFEMQELQAKKSSEDYSIRLADIRAGLGRRSGNQ